MSEVNADGVLLNPHEALLQEVQALTNSLTAEEPEGREDDKAHTVYAGNGEPAGAVGGVPHTPVSAALAAPAHKGAGTGSYAAEHPPAPARKAARAAKTKKPKPRLSTCLSILKNVLTARRNPWSIFLSREGKLTRIPVKKDIKKSLRWL